MTTMPIALYARKSKGQPAEQQLKRLRNQAIAEGCTVVLEAQDVATGKDPNRPGWEQVMAAVKGGHVRSVWITKTDRAMRSARHYLAVVEDVLEPRGCQLRVIDQPMASVTDHKDPLAKAFRSIGAVFAQLEVDLANERSNEGHEVIDGRWYGPSGTPVGRPVGFGPEHKFRNRNGRQEHDRARCRACGGTGGQSATVLGEAQNEGVGEPNGFPTAGLSDADLAKRLATRFPHNTVRRPTDPNARSQEAEVPASAAEVNAAHPKDGA